MPEPAEKTIRSPHDPFAIQQFGRVENARSFFQSYLPPAIVAAADWASLELLRSRLVDGELRSHYPDLLYQVNLGGNPAWIYLLFEHKSSTDPLTAWQLLREAVHIWHDWLAGHPGAAPHEFPPIIPMVLYHGDRTWTPAREFIDLVHLPDDLKPELSPCIPNFHYVLVDLHQLPMGELRGTVQVRIILALMKAVSEGREIEWIEQVFGPLANLLAQESPLDFVRELLIYLSKSRGNVPASTFKAAIAKVNDEATRSEMITLAEQWIEEGRQEGRQEGWQSASRQAILRVLERRFGAVPPSIRSHIQSLTSRAELDHALDLAASIDSIGDWRN